jgi:hypothetical protein
MTEVPLTLDAIATSNQALNRRLDMLNTRLDGLQREAAIVSLRLFGIRLEENQSANT